MRVRQVVALPRLLVLGNARHTPIRRIGGSSLRIPDSTRAGTGASGRTDDRLT